MNRLQTKQTNKDKEKEKDISKKDKKKILLVTKEFLEAVGL